MNRRHFLTGMTAALLTAHTRFLFAAPPRPTILPLWPGTPPGGGGPTGPIELSAKGAQRNISIPTLTRIMPANPNGHAVLVAAGGGYKHIELEGEALPAAYWLAARGYTPWILSYRLPNEGWHDGNKVALQDALRALRIIRQHEKKVSVLGFSAGGHLMGMALTRPDFHANPPTDALDNTRVTVDKGALIYPVITLEKPWTHTSTHKILVGPNATVIEEADWSVQTWVSPRTPPVFLVQAEDDPIANPQNTLIMATACQKAGVPVTQYRYASGGHGFGMGRPGTPTTQWPSQYEKWLALA